MNIITRLTLLSILLVLHTHCQFTNPGCKEFDPNLQCLTCFERFYLQIGICMPVSPLCLTHDLQGKCTSCFTGFDLIDGDCLPAPEEQIEHCEESVNGTECLKCLKGYLLVDGHC